MNRIRSRLAPLAALMAFAAGAGRVFRRSLQPRSRERPPKQVRHGKIHPDGGHPPAVDSGFAPAKLQMLDGVPMLSLYNDAQKHRSGVFLDGGWLGNHRSLHRTSLSGRAGQNAGGNADRLLRRQRPMVAAAETGGALTLYRVDSQGSVRTVLTDTPPAGGTAPYITDFAAAPRGRLPGGRRRKLCSADCGRAERGYFRHDPSQRCGLYLCGIGQPAVSAQPECRNDGCLCASFR